MDTLPTEVLELIATRSPQLWFGLVQVFCQLGNRGRETDFPINLERKFLIKSDDNSGNIFYRLPNGDFHTFEEPCISRNIQMWYKYGELHREDDQPAIIFPDGRREWHYQGRLHRDNDNPAIICPHDNYAWYTNGVLHRENDQPAVCGSYCNDDWYKSLEKTTYTTHRSDKYKKWFYHGQLHRDNDKPAIVYSNNSCMYYQKGLLHRNNNLPAIVSYTMIRLLYRDNHNFRYELHNHYEYHWYKYGRYQYGNRGTNNRGMEYYLFGRKIDIHYQLPNNSIPQNHRWGKNFRKGTKLYR